MVRRLDPGMEPGTQSGAWWRRVWAPTSHRDAPIADLQWPAAVAWFWTIVPLSTAVGILAQRHELTSPGRATVFVAVAALPWVIQLAGVIPPRPLFAALVIAGTVGLLLKPVDIDLA